MILDHIERILRAELVSIVEIVQKRERIIYKVIIVYIGGLHGRIASMLLHMHTTIGHNLDRLCRQRRHGDLSGQVNVAKRGGTILTTVMLDITAHIRRRQGRV